MKYDFNAKYHRSNFLNFLKNDFLPDDLELFDEKIDLEFAPNHIQTVAKVGEVKSLGLTVFEVLHNSENDPRVTLSRDVFRLISNLSIERALVVFHTNKSENYRLSLVTIEFKLNKNKLTREYSNPKRYSYFLGPRAKTNTPEQFLTKGRVSSLTELQNCFSIEVVNRQFYQEIATVFTELTGGQRDIGSRHIDAGNGCLIIPGGNNEKTRKEFAVRLIGRLVFCWFLKKKISSNNVPLIPDDVLSLQALNENSNYYHYILEPLFFETLNKNLEHRHPKYQTKPWDIIPFLNGGLFDPHEEDYYEFDRITGVSGKYINILKVPDEKIKELVTIFETYNFTIDENTSVDIELSIDPEMLGRIFENLLAEINPETGETARKASGSYYTPREVVDYMVDKSLEHYLIANLGIEHTSDVKSLLNYVEDSPSISEEIVDKALDALYNIKILDPACGSGAFPMGVLQKILLILQKLDPESGKWLERLLDDIDDETVKEYLRTHMNTDYIHKLGMIRDSIYGIDIQPIATEISKLRVFLSLIIEENIKDGEPNRGIEPLPNLEFKFVCANTLISLGEQIDFTNNDKALKLQKKLERIRKKYLSSSGESKQKIKDEYKNIKDKLFNEVIGLMWSKASKRMEQLSTWNPFADEPCGWFDSKFMFGVDKGFDIIIGNPPYIKEYTSRAAFDGVREEQYYQGKMDIWYLFACNAIDWLKNNGVHCFIATNNWITNAGASKLRNKVVNETNILQFVDFGNYKIFDNADIQTMVYVLSKSKRPKKYSVNYSRLNNPNVTRDYLSTFLKSDFQTDNYTKRDVEFDRAKFKDKYISFCESNTEVVLKKILDKSNFNFTNDEVAQGIVAPQDFVNRKSASKLGNKYKIGFGIFVLSDEEKNTLNLDEAELKLLKPYYTSNELFKYYGNRNNQQWVIYTRSNINSTIDDYLNIKEHLDRFASVITSDNAPYGLHRARKEHFFQDEKIISIRKCSEPSFTYTDFDCYVSQTYFVIRTHRLNMKYLTGFMNSKIVKFWLKNKGKMQGDNYQVDKAPLMSIPVMRPSTEIQNKIEEMVDTIIELRANSHDDNIPKHEDSINTIVFDMFDLSDDDIAIIEDSIK